MEIDIYYCISCEKTFHTEKNGWPLCCGTNCMGTDPVKLQQKQEGNNGN